MEEFKENKIDKKRLLSNYQTMDFDIKKAKSDLKDLIVWYKSLPDILKLYRIVHVDNKNDIDLINPGSHYSISRKDLISSHDYSAGYGEKKYLITVIADKSMVDVNETLSNNILYPNEREITLKDKGKGVEILSVKKITKPNINESKKISKKEHILNLINKFGIHKAVTILGIPIDLLIDMLSEDFVIDNPETALEFIFFLKEEKKLVKKYKDFIIQFDEMSGVINWIYETPFKTESMYVYATPFWSGTWDIPIEIDEYIIYDWTLSRIESIQIPLPEDTQFNGLNHLIKWFNESYVLQVYSRLHKVREELRKKYNERIKD